MWTLQVLREGQYSKQPLVWIMHGRKGTECQLMTELQPGKSKGFLRPCDLDTERQNLFFIENCPSDWTDHETAQKCKAYAFYSQLPLNVSTKKICLKFISLSLQTALHHRNECTSNTTSGFLDCIMLLGSSYFQFRNIRHLEICRFTIN